MGLDAEPAIDRAGIEPAISQLLLGMDDSIAARAEPDLGAGRSQRVRDRLPAFERRGQFGVIAVLRVARAVITAGERGPVVAPQFVIQPFGRDEAEPFATVTAKADACLVAASLQRFNSGATGQYLREPMATITANSWIKKPGGAAPLGVMAPYLATMRNSQKPWQGADEPTHTITAGGAGITVVAPVLTYAQQGGGNRSIEFPHHTICASRKDQNSLIAATMVQTGYGERPGQAPRALDITAPLGTVVAGGVKHASVAAFLAQHNGSPRMGAHTGHDPRDPLSTVAASGGHQTPVAAFFAKYYGTGDGARTDDPCHTITVKDRIAHVQAGLAAPPFAPQHHARARAVAEFLRAHDAWSGGEFVTLAIGGADYVVIDIGMRMLTPRELFNAQGFPSDYVIEGVWEGPETDDPQFRAFAKDVQVSCCGNSVCPPLAAAIVGANCQHLIIQKEAAIA